MRPISYTIKDDVTTFHYDPIEFAEFHRLGKQDGNVGGILIQRKGIAFTYECYGTIENPMTHTIHLTLNHHEQFDGKMPTDEELLLPLKPKGGNFIESYRMVFINTSEYDGKPIINKWK